MERKKSEGKERLVIKARRSSCASSVLSTALESVDVADFFKLFLCTSSLSSLLYFCIFGFLRYPLLFVPISRFHLWRLVPPLSILKFYTFPCFAFWLGNTRPRFRHRTPKRDAIVSGCITPSACSRCHAHQRTRANTNFLTSFLCTKETLSLCCSTARPRLRSLSLSTLVDFHPLGKVSDPKSDSD